MSVEINAKSEVVVEQSAGLRRAAVYVFELPVRIWHWTHALSITVLAITGYLIANPLPSIGGEASEHFLMGNLRFVHFVAGYVFAIGFIVRLYWALVGNPYSRELVYLPVWRRDWWRGLWSETRYYSFLSRDESGFLGHNPLAQSAMWLFNFVLTLFMIFTGFALYSEGLGLGSWADTLFGWVLPLMGGSQSVRMWHIFGMWLILVFVIIHIYMAIRADVLGKHTSVSTIFSGWRHFRD
jgi:Ni/Fe-hydrogenase 1 B-type cytochrome subunit